MTNETLSNLLTRRSIKKYKPEQITEEQLQAILEAGQYAPSGMNKQSPVFVAVQDPATVEKLARMNIPGGKSNPFYGAPTVVLVLVSTSVSTGVEDASLAIGNMCNAAHALGLGSCWIHRAKEMFETEEGKALLQQWGVEGNYRGVGCFIVGHADEEKKPSPRREGRVFYIR